MFVIPSSGKKQLRSKLQAFQDDENDEGQNVEGDDVSSGLKDRQARLKAAGQDHADQQRWAEALACWDEGIALLASSASTRCPGITHELHELRAQVLLTLGRDFEAIQSASKAISISPAFAPAFVTLSRAQLNFGEPQLALKSLQRCLALEPGHPEALHDLSTVQMLALQQERAGPGHRAHVVAMAAAHTTGTGSTSQHSSDMMMGQG